MSPYHGFAQDPQESMLQHQLKQGYAMPISGEHSNNEFLSKEQQRAQFDSESHRKFMRSLG